MEKRNNITVQGVSIETLKTDTEKHLTLKGSKNDVLKALASLSFYSRGSK